MALGTHISYASISLIKEYIFTKTQKLLLPNVMNMEKNGHNYPLSASKNKMISAYSWLCQDLKNNTGKKT